MVILNDSSDCKRQVKVWKIYYRTGLNKCLCPLNSYKLKVVGAEISGPAITHDHCTYDSGHVTVVRN